MRPAARANHKKNRAPVYREHGFAVWRSHVQIRVEREACAQIQNLRTHGGHSGLALVDQAADERADLAHFVLAHAAGRDGRRAETHATRDAHGLRVERDGVFIGGDVRRIQQILHLRASAAAAVDVG